MTTTTASRSVLLLLLAVITITFFAMIKSFLMAVLLAGIFSSLTQPLYKKLRRTFKGRETLASITTLLLIVLVFILPLGFMLGLVTAEAIKVGNSITPWVQDKLTNPDQIMVWLQNQPFYDKVAPYQDDILTKAGDMVGWFSKFLINSLSAATSGTVQFLFMLMIMLYSMYFFLIDGSKLINLIASDA